MRITPFFFSCTSSSPATLPLVECLGVLRPDYPSNLPLEATPHQCSLPSTQGATSNFSKCPLDTPLRDLGLLVVHQPPTVDRYVSLYIKKDDSPY